MNKTMSVIILVMMVGMNLALIAVGISIVTYRAIKKLWSKRKKKNHLRLVK